MEDVTVHQSARRSALFNSFETAASIDIVLVKISSIHNTVIIIIIKCCMFLNNIIVVQTWRETGRENGGFDYDEMSAFVPADTDTLPRHVQGRLSRTRKCKGKYQIQKLTPNWSFVFRMMKMEIQFLIQIDSSCLQNMYLWMELIC